MCCIPDTHTRTYTNTHIFISRSYKFLNYNWIWNIFSALHKQVQKLPISGFIKTGNWGRWWRIYIPIHILYLVLIAFVIFFIILQHFQHIFFFHFVFFFSILWFSIVVNIPHLYIIQHLQYICTKYFCVPVMNAPLNSNIANLIFYDAHREQKFFVV
jgi:hypothetical protein